MRLLIIGNRGGTNIGGCFERAALAAGLEVNLLEARWAMQAPDWVRRLNWHLLGHRPARLRSFGRTVVETVARFEPDIVLATGIAPLDCVTLESLKQRAVPVVNYLTDDPWNPEHRAAWFLRSLPKYAAVFSTRRSNLADLERAGCASVAYLPFGYDPGLHFRQANEGPEEMENDVLFVGAADPERAAYCTGLLQRGIRLSLYGDFWDRFKHLKGAWHGYAGTGAVREISKRSRAQLCLVRQANRDGHTMRSFEAAALGGCLMVQDTLEHREIFGPDRESVLYFGSVSKLERAATGLLSSEAERRRLGRSAHARITQGANTYFDRLRTILEGSPLSGAARPLAPQWVHVL